MNALGVVVGSEFIQYSREGRLPESERLAALSALARKKIETRGRVADADIDRFIAAGFGKDHALRPRSFGVAES
jgi:hypothetical protein